MRGPVLLGAVALALAATTPATAQLRLAGGISLTDFIGGDAAGTDGRQGLDLGLSMRMLRVGPVQLRAEGYYRQKGAKNVLELQEAAQTGEPLEVGIDYVEVPVLLRLDLPGLGGLLFPYLQGGPAFAWRIDCGYRFAAATGGRESKCDDLSSENLEQTFKQYEQGLVLGGGIDLPILGIGAIGIDARYTRGLSRITDGANLKNAAFSVMLGYSFGLHYGAPGLASTSGMPVR